MRSDNPAEKVTSILIPLWHSDLKGTRSDRFHEIKGLLINKYGTPKDEIQRREDQVVVQQMRTTAVWVLPSTTISLIWVEDSDHLDGYVNILYTPVDKKSMDSL